MANLHRKISICKVCSVSFSTLTKLTCSNKCSSQLFRWENPNRANELAARSRLKKQLSNPNSRINRQDKLKPLITGEVASIPINNKEGLFTTVDTDCLSLIKGQCSMAHSGYIMVSGEYLHRIIMSAPKGIQVDHINRDKINNRRSNLRLVSNTQNQQNRKTQVTSLSGYKGVSAMKSKGEKKWMVRITVYGKHLYIGSFKTKEEAAIAYDNAARLYFGKYAYLNFPVGQLVPN